MRYPGLQSGESSLQQMMYKNVFHGVRRFIVAFVVRDLPRYTDLCRELIPGTQSDIEMSHSKGKTG
jgi:hypothetical protein